MTGATATLASRCFNRVTVDREARTVRKSTTRPSTLRDEYHWYGSLPSTLSDLVPSVLDWRDEGATAHMVLSQAPGAPLATLLLNDTVAPDWHDLLVDVMGVHDRLRHHRMPLDRGDVHAMYVSKTRARLGALASQSAEWRDVLARGEVTCNGRLMSNVFTLWPLIERRAEELARTASGTIIHGDFCFSNILRDPTDKRITLVDPRGRFGPQGVGGDPRYDAAKLRHSAVGGYDLIAADRFSVEWAFDEFTGAVDAVPSAGIVAPLVDSLLQAAGHDLDDVAFIEALLFLSMTPLHVDALNRQVMMYLTGITRLNEVLA